MRILGVNAVFRDPAAALAVDGWAAAEEEHASRRTHGKAPARFSTWELPEQALRWCRGEAGLAPGGLAYSHDSSLTPACDGDMAGGWEGLRTRCWPGAPQRTRGGPGAAGSPRGAQPGARDRGPAAVLFDRDGTLVYDEPYNGDPAKVVIMPGSRAALDRLRAAGVPTAVISNQSGVARGLLTTGQVQAVNARVEELLGPLGPWLTCPHGPDDGCDCRKPRPGLIRRAAALLGVRAADCVVIGDIGSDIDAAHAAGAWGILVPTPVTRAEEVATAPLVAPTLPAAVDLALGGTSEALR